MPKRSFEHEAVLKLNYKLHKPIWLVFDYLTDMQKFTSVHPVIYKIEDLSENRYLVYEKLSFIPFTYSVIVKSNTLENTVLMEATVMKFTKITIQFSLKSEHNTTIVNEEILISTIFPIKPIIKSVFKKQHKKLFSNIDQLKINNA